MLRRVPFVLAASIPRSVWDPQHYNPNWSDSYGHDIASRRHWPAKKWSIGLEPRTPRDWLQYSLRNLSYAYNGALRSCQSFPEMLVYYKEMKQRGVKVDVDTMNVLLTRAARYERVRVDDVFLLFDELLSLGARPDLAAVETLHTVWDHSASMPPAWREARRLQLLALYNALASEALTRLAPHRAERLLRAQMQRLRGNLQQLRGGLEARVLVRYIPHLHTAAALLGELDHFLWARVGADHPAMELPALRMRVPFLASAMRRPRLGTTAPKTTPTRADFEDAEVCAVFGAVAARVVDGDVDAGARFASTRRLFLSLLTMLSYSGLLLTADLLAQMMDMVKYADTPTATRDADAQRLLRYALRGSSAAGDEAMRAVWQRVEHVADGRVVGRYLAARDPWSPVRVCLDEKGIFRPYPTRVRAAPEGERAEVAPPLHSKEEMREEMREGVRGGLLTEESARVAGGGTDPTPSPSAERTAEGLEWRWADVRRVIERTGALTTEPNNQHPQQEKMEVFTGMAVYLRTVATGQHYNSYSDSSHSSSNPNHSNNSNSSGHSTMDENEAEKGVAVHPSTPHSPFAEGYPLDLWQRLFECVQELRQDMEKFIADNAAAHRVEPEFECWEALLITLRCILDFCVLHRQQGGKDQAEQLFNSAMTLRAELIEESRTRFGGRMRILWLQEV